MTDRLQKFAIHLCSVVCCLWTASAPAQEFHERFADWPVETSIGGRVIVSLATGSNGRDRVAELLPGGEIDGGVILLGCDNGLMDSFADLFSPEHPTRVPDRYLIGDSKSDSVDFETLIQKAKIVCWCRKRPLSKLQRDNVVRKSSMLRRFLQTGCTVVLAGSPATVAGDAFCQSGAEQAVRGCGVIPDVIFSDHTFATESLIDVLTAQPRTVGMRICPDIAVVLDGRKIRISGPGHLDAVLPATQHQPVWRHSLVSQSKDAPDPNSWLLDLTQWRRDAIDRTLEPFPPRIPPNPSVDHGMLMIVGGGGLPKGLMKTFVEHAGGQESAKLVYIPCRESDEVGRRHGIPELWKQLNVRCVNVLHTKDRLQANSDQRFLKPLKEATGIWFGGGRQWNFSDSYYGTRAHRLMKDVLSRGGVIGGSSAGASIQASYLARATPIGNTQIMAPGYARGGLGFIRGVAIDQHFSQRKRQPDMSQLVNRYPQLLGIGIDETTALIVQKSTAEVVGRGHVFFYNRRQHTSDDRPDYLSLSAGAEYDLSDRRVVRDERD